MAGHSATPLFPRLHVNDTEKQGPKAPPRNKMALYEQFTLPSHGLLHLAPASTAIPYHQQQYASDMYQYPFLSYHVPPSSIQPASSDQLIHMYAQPSIATSSIVMSNSSYVLNDNESRRSSDRKIVGDSAHSDAPKTVNNRKQGSKAEGVLNQRIKNNQIPLETIETSNVVPQNLSQSQQPKSVVSAGIIGTANCSHEAVNGVQVGSSHPESYADFGVHVDLGEVAELNQNTTTDENVVKERVGKAMILLEKDELTLPAKSCQQSGHIDNGSNIEFGNSRETENNPGQARLQSGQERDHDRTSVTVSDCEQSPVQTFRPKDVMRQMGQQQFWKARKALLRQQRVFSDQVFELHRLTRVQQLLAKIPGTLLDEAMHFRAMDKGIVSSVRDVTMGAEILIEKENVSISSKGKPGVEEAVAPRVSAQSISEKSQNVKNVDMEARNSRVQDFNNVDLHLKPNVPMVGAVSWGYPRMGAGPWTDPQGRPMNLWNFPGPLSPGFPCGRFYGLPMVGTMPSIMPIGFPVGHHGQETSESRMPCAISNQNLDSSAASRNLSHTHQQQFTGPWYYMPQISHDYYNSLSYNQILHNTRTKEAPQGSGASINNHVAESMKSSSTPGVEMQWPFKAAIDERKVGEKLESNALLSCCKGSEQMESSNVSDGQQGVEGGHRMVEKATDFLNLFPEKPTSAMEPGDERRAQVIKVVPRSARTASRSTAGILLSLQQERRK